MTAPRPVTSQHGFTLVEVLVALIVMGIGLLGIAKLNALALSSTGTARMRSLAALEASSLASSMHANREYWAGSPATTTVVAAAAVSSTTDATLSSAVTTAPSCTSGNAAPCSAAYLAAYDLANWATALNSVLPHEAATVACTSTAPIACTITIQWSENTVNVNTQEVAAASTAFQTQNYVLVVEP